MGSLALKCHFLSLKGAFFQKTMFPASSSPSLLKEKDKKSSLIWHLFLTTNDRGAMELINRNEKSVRGLDCYDFIVKVTSRGLGCHETIGKVTSLGLDCHETIGKVIGRGLGCYESIGKVTGRSLDCHESIGKVTGQDLDCHETIGKVTGRGLGHYKTSLNTNN